MGGGSFFGALVYDRAVPPDHFLRRLRELVDWEGLTQEWVALYEGGAEYGPPPYHPGLVLKMLFLTYLYVLGAGASNREAGLLDHDHVAQPDRDRLRRSSVEGASSRPRHAIARRRGKPSRREYARS